MKIQEYVDLMKELQNLLLVYVESDADNEVHFHNLVNYINIQKEQWNKEDYEHFLHLISSVINNHHRDSNLFMKIEKILIAYSEQIKKTFTNQDIYELFQKNKKMLLFLIENNNIFLRQ